ncbi:hypothetical protein [Lacipirellula parvula]|uniref:hypothetical protein n=1 Tax=Lacipirellula parvula TaxID=2650471 RepID=UPI0012606122|nr:hypothetical protein [Lacipirellula parvula]
MSQPSFESDSPAPTVLTKKSAWNIYTALLLISLLALMLASLFFALEISEYGFGTQNGPLSMSVPGSLLQAASGTLWA